MGYRIGIDIGGTFTDLVMRNDQGDFFMYKEDSTPSEPLRAINRGLVGLADEVSLSVEQLLQSTDVLVHGQTTATNALIERNGPKIGLLATKGFRDITYFGYSGKPERYNIHLAKPEDFVPRNLRLGVTERLNKHGEIIKPLAEDEVRAAASYYRDADVKAIAVAFLWSFVNPSHEKRAAEILREELPDVEVFCSSDVLPEIGEWERTSATMLSAYISPIIKDYLAAFQAMLRDAKLAHKPLLMQVNGGCSPIESLLEKPVYAVASGPAAGPAAGSFYASKTKWPDHLIIVDMGGTSFDICMLRDGEPVMSRDIKVEGQPIGVNGVEVLSVGAGGGSIAWIDDGGSLRVGPRSAGSEPGPACYGRGGTEPTVTDANLVAGRMSSKAFLGGRRSLDLERSREAIKEKIADPLGISIEDAAGGILTIVNSNMVSAIRSISVERGIDPREYVMVAGGGAGGLHAADCARMLGIEETLIPRSSGGLCAFGMSVTPVRHDYVRAFHCVTDENGVANSITSVFDELLLQGRSDLESDGFQENDMSFTRYLEGRYVGQVHNITIPLPEGKIDAEYLRRLESSFHEEHEKRFTYAMRGQPIEAVHWRLVGTAGKPGRLDEYASAENNDPSPTSTVRDAYLPATDEVHEVTIWNWDDLRPGFAFQGPVIIESSTTTIVINPEDRAVIQADGSVLISLPTKVI